VVAAALHVPAVQPASTLDHQAIGQFGDLSAEHVQGRRQGVNAVTLFDPQFLGSADDRGALAKGATTATTALIMARTTSAPSIAIPRSVLVRTSRSPTGSPQTSRGFRVVIFPPIACKTSSTPVRVGFRPTHTRTVQSRDHQGRANEKRRR